jgi:hypothetical protein
MNLHTYYHIIPVGDGYNILAKDENGNHFLKEKACRDRIFVLNFKTEEEAQDYIDVNLNPSDWVTEYFLTVEEII